MPGLTLLSTNPCKPRRICLDQVTQIVTGKGKAFWLNHAEGAFVAYPASLWAKIQNSVHLVSDAGEDGRSVEINQANSVF